MQNIEGVDNLKVTSFSDLEKYSKGVKVELPPFGNGQPFVAMMRRPSMLKLAKEGMIPNSLIKSANKLFYKGGDVTPQDLDDVNLLANTVDAIMPIIGASLLSPTLEEIEKAGISLTDDQVMFIFNYTQRGVQALENFRK